MDNRKEDRIKKCIRLRLKDGEVTVEAVVTSISKKGMSVTCTHVFPAYKVIDVICKISQQVIPIKGSIRWVNELPHSGAEKKYEIGIALTNPPEEYLMHFEDSKES